MIDLAALPKTIPLTTKPALPSIGQVLTSLLDPILRQSGFVESDLLTRWAEIIGPRLASLTIPCRLEWRGHWRPPQDAHPPTSIGKEKKPKKNRRAKLIIKVDPAFLLDVAHVTTHIQECVNTYFGWPCIEQIKLEPDYDPALRVPPSVPAPPRLYAI